MPNHGIVDLFSGAGGISVGAMMANKRIRPAVAVDLDEDALASYAANIGGVAMRGDLTDAQFRRDVIREARAAGATIVVGGVPCQGFSGLNNQRKNAHYSLRNDLLPRAFFDVVFALKPALVMMEEVPNFPKDKLDSFAEQLQRRGYLTKSAVLNAKDYGAPQSRRRLILVAARDAAVIANFPPPPTHPTPVSVAEALGALADRGVPRPVSETAERWVRMRETIDPVTGRDKLILAKPRWFKASFGVIDQTKPSPTLTTHLHSAGSGTFTLKRPDGAYTALTAEEARCLQSFPPSFHFTGRPASVYRQIGNSVPPKLAAGVFEALALP